MDLDNKLLHLAAEKRMVEEEMNQAKIRAQQQLTDVNHELNRTDIEKNNWFRRAEDLDKCLQSREQEIKDIKFDLDYAKTTSTKKEDDLQNKVTNLELENTRCRESINELERTLSLSKTN